MNPKTKNFDCVAESRKWREVASARLNAMSAEEELSYLHALGERVRPQLQGNHLAIHEPVALREESPAYAKEKTEHG